MDDSQPQFELSETDFLALLVKHEPALRACARSLVPDWELVDEALQEASITLWQKREQLQGTDGFVPWAITVLRFKCLRQLEKLRARRPLLSNEMLETLAQRGAQRSTEESTARAQALGVCLSQFSEEHRELLLAPHIQRYSLGLCSEEEVNELERRLRADETLQDEFLREEEIDSHLRQEAHLGFVDLQVGLKINSRFGFPSEAAPSSARVWKWVSGTSTLAATVLVAPMTLNFPPQQNAMAFPSLGQLTVEVSRTQHNIWASAADCDFSAVNDELENRVSVDGKAECGLTPLHVAVLFGQSEVVGLLLSSGADVSLTDVKGNTALNMAAFLGHTEIVRALLKAGADPAVRNHLGFSSVDTVAVRWSSDLEAYYHHLEKVLDVPLDLEQIQSERSKVLKLLSAVNQRSTPRTPTISLWQAAITGNTAVVEQHIAAETNLDEKEDYGDSTPLILAAIFGKDEVAKILINAWADLEVRDAKGSTALHQARFFYRPEIVGMLLTAGADPSLADSRGHTPLEIVTLDFDKELHGTYRHVYDWLNLELDLDEIKRARTQIAGMLQDGLNLTTDGDAGSHNVQGK